MKVLLANPRGFCAGVDRAIDVVEIALQTYGAPVYVRHEIVHNDLVCDELREKGAVFVDDLSEVPEGSLLIFSAHGVSPAVRTEAEERKLKVLDATCPLVTKVHLEAVRFARKGYSIVLVGHRGHVEVEGTMGEAPESITLVESPEDVANLELKNPDKIIYLTQTTLSVDDANVVIEALKQRFPHIEAPPTEDICYATTNRQAAVKQMASDCDMILVIGSPTSSNSNRLVEVAIHHGCRSQLINDASQMNQVQLEGVSTLGITAGASAPESLVQEVLKWLHDHHPVEQQDYNVVQEDVTFTLPRELVTLARQERVAGNLLEKHVPVGR
ncbi:MAG: 4-hydroxy-3-methylbut-2-enyl diphosphate reductase [Candidatus Eremiobacterota bacterium]